MSNNLMSIQDLNVIASTMAPIFGKKPQEALALMFIAQAEGKHPAIAMQEWDIIQGRPALKSTAVLGRFQQMGGRIQWIERTDKVCKAKFFHEQGGEVEVEWTIEMAQKAGLTNKPTWKNHPRQMLSARVASEGARACFPACLSGFYIEDEAEEIEPLPPRVEGASGLDPQKEIKQEFKSLTEKTSVSAENFQKLTNLVAENKENWKPKYWDAYDFTEEQINVLADLGISK